MSAPYMRVVTGAKQDTQRAAELAATLHCGQRLWKQEIVLQEQQALAQQTPKLHPCSAGDWLSPAMPTFPTCTLLEAASHFSEVLIGFPWVYKQVHGLLHAAGIACLYDRDMPVRHAGALLAVALLRLYSMPATPERVAAKRQLLALWQVRIAWDGKG